jgi:hypothetical protein
MKKNILIAFIGLGLIGILCSLWLMMTAQDASDFRLSYISLFGWGIVFGASAIAECETN